MRFRENMRGITFFWQGGGVDFGNQIVEPVRRLPYMKY